MPRFLAAAATPLKDEARALDEDAFAPLLEFLAAGGMDGILALGTTGEGFLLSVEERMRAAALFQNGYSIGSAGVAVIAPPYFRLDESALLAHFEAAACACAPTPFYIYEFARASGYAVAPAVIERLRERAPNLAGLKVSDSPWDAFAPYLIEGLDVYVGPEALISQGLEHGAAGAVSALATAFPEKVAGVSPDLADIRAAIERLPRHAALKRVLARRGVPVREDVRSPLRGLTDDERQDVDSWLESLLPAQAR